MPCFHDAEVVDMRLARTGDTLATLRFDQVHDLDVSGFNRQNAIHDFTLEDAGAHPLASGLRAIRVTLAPSYGVGISFLCGDIEVSAVGPGPPPYSVYSD